MSYGGQFDYDALNNKITVVTDKLNDPDIWNDRAKITDLNKELKSHTSLKSTIDEIYSDIDLISYTLETILDDSSHDDEKLLIEMSELHKSATSRLEKLSFTQLFRGENDDANAYIDIQSGSGGTEAQDWVLSLIHI